MTPVCLSLGLLGPWPAQSACTPRYRTSGESVSALTDDPGALLRRHRNDQAGLAVEVNTFVLSDLATLPVLLKLSRTASVEQRQSVGYGLGRAAAYCTSRDGDVGRRIAEGVRTLGDRDVSFGFRLAQQGLDSGAPRLGSLSPDGGGTALRTGDLDGGVLPMRGESDAGAGRLSPRLSPDSHLDARDLDLPSLKAR